MAGWSPTGTPTMRVASAGTCSRAAWPATASRWRSTAPRAGHFLDPAPTSLVRAGSAELRWDSCQAARLDYDIEAGRGSYPLTRLTGSCDDAGSAPQQ